MSNDPSNLRPEEIDQLVGEVMTEQSLGDHDPSDPGPPLTPHSDPTAALKRARALAHAPDPAHNRSLDPEATEPAPTVVADDEFHLVISGYRDLKRVNHGAQGALYQGVHEETNRRVAVKVLWNGVLATAAERERFKRESEMLAVLEHPFIVRITGRGRTETGLSYIVMDFVEGKPLDEYLTAQPRLRADRNKLLGLFMKIAEAVGAAHDAGITHRDLKPSNIRVDDHGNPRILDFGLARSSIESADGGATVTATGQFVGSLPWVSPEQAEGRHAQVDARSDVYALGMILYYMLTGRFPFNIDHNMVGVLEQIVRGQRRAPSAIRSPDGQAVVPGWLNEHLDAIVLKAVAIDRDDRYASGAAMASTIDAFINGRPLPMAVAGRQWPRQMRVVTVLLALGFGIALVIWAVDQVGDQAVDPGQPPLVPTAVTPDVSKTSLALDGVYGGGGGQPFEDSGEGPLVGIRVWKKRFSEHTVIAGVQPVYRTSTGVTYGKVFGQQTDQSDEDIAPHGVAVGGMRIQWGQRVDGVGLRFVPLGLGEPSSGRWMGGQTGDNLIDGNGKAAVGIRGRAGDELDAIGLIFRE